MTNSVPSQLTPEEIERYRHYRFRTDIRVVDALFATLDAEVALRKEAEQRADRAESRNGIYISDEQYAGFLGLTAQRDAADARADERDQVIARMDRELEAHIARLAEAEKVIEAARARHPKWAWEGSKVRKCYCGEVDCYQRSTLDAYDQTQK